MNSEIQQEVLSRLFSALDRENFVVSLFSVTDDGFQLDSSAESAQENKAPGKEATIIPLKFLRQVQDGENPILNLDEIGLEFPEVVQFTENLGLRQLACLPVMEKAQPVGIFLIGSKDDVSLSQESLQPYISTIDLASTILEQSEHSILNEQPQIPAQSSDFIISSNILSGDLSNIYVDLHEHTKRLIGNFPFLICLYDEKKQAIQIPYSFDEGKISSIESFPIGEGLTSILIRTQQPLLLNQDTERQAQALGAKIEGRPAKSWMGVPLMSEGRAIGGLVLQDLEKENAFKEKDLQNFLQLAHQVAGIIQIILILDENRRHLLQVQTAAEIARDISSALNLDELLLNAVNLIRERFNYYHAAIFLVDNTGENAVVREATGEAGAQMKRMGHKLAVGSKSVVGNVASQGEPLIVNDTNKDITHLPNPLLPETSAEAALPLRIGERILGALDVQSNVPYSFGPQEISTLQILADQLAIAVNNSELFAETQEHLSQHRLLHHITTSAASGTTLDEALSSTVQGLQVTLGGDRVSIFLVDEDHKNLVTKAWVGYSPETAQKIIPVGSGITGWVAAHRKPLRIADVTQDARYIELSPNTKSELALPLIFRNDVLGVLNVESEQAGAYSENDEEILGTLAGSIAAIVANARLIEQIRKQVERERQLNEITNKIRRSTDVQSILLTTINELNRITGAQHTQIRIGVNPPLEDSSVSK